MKKLILILLVVTNISLFSQKKTSNFENNISVYQDFKMMVYENEHGLTAPTLNVVIKLNVIELNSFGVGLSYERANLYHSVYNRYTLDMFNFRFKVLKKVTLEPIVSIGLIHRFGDLYPTFGIENKTMYKVSKRFKIGVLSSYVRRSDIGIFRFNNYVGLEYRIR